MIKRLACLTMMLILVGAFLVGCTNVSDMNTYTIENNNTDSVSDDISNYNDDTEEEYVQEGDVGGEQFEEESFYHTAIKGAVIVSQDGGKSFSYQGHCEACGKTDTTMTKNTTASSGVLKSSFLCPNCGNQQSIEIESGKN